MAQFVYFTALMVLCGTVNSLGNTTSPQQQNKGATKDLCEVQTSMQIKFPFIDNQFIDQGVQIFLLSELSSFLVRALMRLRNLYLLTVADQEAPPPPQKKIEDGVEREVDCKVNFQKWCGWERGVFSSLNSTRFPIA